MRTSESLAILSFDACVKLTGLWTKRLLTDESPNYVELDNI